MKTLLLTDKMSLSYQLDQLADAAFVSAKYRDSKMTKKRKAKLVRLWNSFMRKLSS